MKSLRDITRKSKALKIIQPLLAHLFLSAPCLAEVGDSFAQQFEEKYDAWVCYVKTSGAGLQATGTAVIDNHFFEEIVQMGAPALPLIAGKLEEDPFGLFLEPAIQRIAMVRIHSEYDKMRACIVFPDYPHMKAEDSVYLRWWKEDRFKTGERFEELYGKWRALKSERKDLEAEAVYREIVDLGIPVLPYLEGKVGRHPEFVPAMSRLSGKALSKTASPAECRAWWAENRKRFELPPRASGKASEK